MDHSSSKSLSLSSPAVVIGLLVFSIGLIVGGIIGVTAAGGIDEIRQSLASVRGDVNRMRWESETLKKQVSGFEVAMESGKTELAEKLAGESARITRLDTQVEGLAKGQEKLKKEGANFAAKLGAEIRRINDLDGKIKAVETAASAQAEKTKQLAADRDAIRNDLKDLEAEFGKTDSSFDQLVGALAGLGQKGAE